MSGRSSRNSRRELGERARVLDAARSTRVAWRSGDVPDRRGVRGGDVRARRRHADHLVAGGARTLELRPEQQLEADVGRGDVDDDRAACRRHVVAAAYRRRFESPAQRRPRAPCPPAALRPNHRWPSLIWIGERARRYGSVAPVRVRPGPGERGRTEPGPHRPLGGGRSGTRLRVGEVERRPAELLADQLDRAVELVVDRVRRRAGRAARGVWVCEPTSTSPVASVAERGPRQRRPVVGEAAAAPRRTRSRRRASPGCRGARARERRRRRSRRCRRRT